MVSVPAVNSSLSGGGLTLALPAGGVVVGDDPHATSKIAAASTKMRALIPSPLNRS
jgi:hypothetical protein